MDSLLTIFICSLYTERQQRRNEGVPYVLSSTDENGFDLLSELALRGQGQIFSYRLWLSFES